MGFVTSVQCDGFPCRVLVSASQVAAQSQNVLPLTSYHVITPREGVHLMLLPFWQNSQLGIRNLCDLHKHCSLPRRLQYSSHCNQVAITAVHSSGSSGNSSSSCDTASGTRCRFRRIQHIHVQAPVDVHCAGCWRLLPLHTLLGGCFRVSLVAFRLTARAGDGAALHRSGASGNPA